jgi:hypothetical protein
MTDAELDEVEAALDRPLPADYRSFVRTCSVPDRSRYCQYLYVSPKEMIRENQAHPRRSPDSDIREPDGTGGVRDRPWPTEWTIIGDGDSEWYTFVRPDAPGVWEWQHDTREVAQVAASFGEYLERQRERIGPPPVLEVTRHPILGELSWNPERRTWRAEVAGVGVFLKPWDEDRDAFLTAAAGLVPAAVSAGPRVLADAMAAGGWAEFLEWTDGDDHGLTADTARDRLGRPVIGVFPGPVIEYQYQPDEELDFIAFWVKTDARLVVTEQGWVR